MAQDLLLQLLQVPGRIDPELVGEQLSRALEGAERVRLAARAVQRQHQHRPDPFAERMGAVSASSSATTSPCWPSASWAAIFSSTA